MPFSKQVQEDALVKCGRFCCLCHKYAGTHMEVHHIIQESDDGSNDFDNAIPLCLDCHAEMGKSDPKHPKRKAFSVSELKRQRDNWYKLYANGQTHISNNIDEETVRTDDEKIVLYYMLQYELIIAKIYEIEKWTIEEEIHTVNLENARKLLSSSDDKNIVELSIEQFRDLLKKREELLNEYKGTVENHRRLASSIIKTRWKEFNDTDKLFLKYIIDTKASTLGTRWMTQIEIEQIKRWEKENELNNSIIDYYAAFLSKLIEYDIVYESNWTSYGNPKQYTLYNSALEFLYNLEDEFKKDLDETMDRNIDQLPF